jgi:glucuronoarabinoxylan endo-1,4-beta-xylanase
VQRGLTRWALTSAAALLTAAGVTAVGAPDAHAATTGDPNLGLSAFRNADGSLTVVGLNASTSAAPVRLSLRNTGITTGTATPYLTDGTHNTARQSAISVTGGTLDATLPARSLVTYTIPR